MAIGQLHRDSDDPSLAFRLGKPCKIDFSVDIALQYTREPGESLCDGP